MFELVWNRINLITNMGYFVKSGQHLVMLSSPSDDYDNDISSLDSNTLEYKVNILVI